MATTFTTVASMGMFMFVGQEITPLFYSGCAYKSPLVPIFVAGGAAFTGLATVITRSTALGIEAGCKFLVRCRLMARSFYECSVVPWIESIRNTPLHRWMFVGIHQFWANREMDHALRHEPLAKLGYEGLFQVLSTTDGAAFNNVKNCPFTFRCPRHPCRNRDQGSWLFTLARRTLTDGRGHGPPKVACPRAELDLSSASSRHARSLDTWQPRFTEFLGDPGAGALIAIPAQFLYIQDTAPYSSGHQEYHRDATEFLLRTPLKYSSPPALAQRYGNVHSPRWRDMYSHASCV